MSDETNWVSLAYSIIAATFFAFAFKSLLIFFAVVFTLAFFQKQLNGMVTAQRRMSKSQK